MNNITLIMGIWFTQSKINLALPYLILATLGVIGVLASMFLPETLHSPLPESIEDADNIGKTAPFWSYLPNQPTKCTKPQPEKTKEDV